MRKLNYDDCYDRSDMEISAYDQQLWSPENWAPVALNLRETLREDGPEMTALMEALRLTLDNGSRQAGIKALLDLVHPVREREAEKAVAKACGVVV